MSAVLQKVSVVLPVLAPTPFLRAMTEFAIRTLRAHADTDFELIVVEAGEPYFDPTKAVFYQGMDHDGTPAEPAVMLSKQDIDPKLRIDKYINFNPKIGCVKELNAGVDAATGDFVLSTGNDVIVPPHWDRELLRCFDERRDCAVASLSAYEPGVFVGPEKPMDMIVEGMYSPFMMFRKGGRFDEAFVKIYQDSDFVMRQYEKGLRAYRSCRTSVHHLCRMTSDRVEPDQHRRDLDRDEKLFYQRWGNSPLMMFAMIRFGAVQYGKEWGSYITPVGGRPDHPGNGRRI